MAKELTRRNVKISTRICYAVGTLLTLAGAGMIIFLLAKFGLSVPKELWMKAKLVEIQAFVLLVWAGIYFLQGQSKSENFELKKSLEELHEEIRGLKQGE